MCTPEPPKSANHQGQIDDRDFHDISIYFHDFVANHVSATTMCMGIHRKETWKDVMRGSQSSYQSVRVHHGCPLRTVQLGNFRETVADWSLNQVRRKLFEIISTRFVSNKPCYVLLRSKNTLGRKTVRILFCEVLWHIELTDFLKTTTGSTTIHTFKLKTAYSGGAFGSGKLSGGWWSDSLHVLQVPMFDSSFKCFKSCTVPLF